MGGIILLFKPLEVAGAYLIEIDRKEDERGFFARTWCAKEFEAQGLKASLAQCNMSYNKQKGTLRGLHYQLPPHQETKIVRCTTGGIYDVILDLRPDSPTYLKWCGVELWSHNHQVLYVPEGCGHGIQTLADHTEVMYMVSEFYTPEAERGVMWNDPVFAIEWPPAEQRIISEKDQNHPPFVL